MFRDMIFFCSGPFLIILYFLFIFFCLDKHYLGSMLYDWSYWFSYLLKYQLLSLWLRNKYFFLLALCQSDLQKYFQDFFLLSFVIEFLWLLKNILSRHTQYKEKEPYLAQFWRLDSSIDGASGKGSDAGVITVGTCLRGGDDMEGQEAAEGPVSCLCFVRKSFIA